MRTTIDLPTRDHELLKGLARARGVSLSKLVVELTRRGLEAHTGVREPKTGYRVNPVTGLPTFRSARPITIDDARALEDEA